jgi:hypothetical protein
MVSECRGKNHVWNCLSMGNSLSGVQVEEYTSMCFRGGVRVVTTVVISFESLLPCSVTHIHTSDLCPVARGISANDHTKGRPLSRILTMRGEL